MKLGLWITIASFCLVVNAKNEAPGGDGVTPLFSHRGWTESGTAKNLALLVGVSKGLPGIDLDLDNVERMGKHTDYNFVSARLWNPEATVANVVKKTKEIGAQVDEDGTFLFYFSGHGGKETLLMEDRTMKITELRAALEESRKDVGPFKRLLLFFDSCYSGSLLPKFRDMLGLKMLGEADMAQEVNDIVTALQPSSRDTVYYDKLFVFASSRADETSMAGSTGSAFTVALGKAFDESMTNNNTIGEFVKKTYDYTVKHHPVARLVPEDLNNEKMRL